MMLIDFHSHTLPFADHGCKTKDDFDFQIAQAQKNGVGTVIATPHFYPHRDTLEGFLRCKERGIENALGKTGDIDYKVGAEVLLCIGLDKMEGVEKLCIDGTDIMLVEIPRMPMSYDFYQTLRELNRRFRVVIAHVDRYLDDVVEKLIEEEYMLQLGADCFNLRNHFRVKRILESGLVYALGSDIHQKDSRAYPRLVRAHRKCKGINTRMRRLIYGE